MKNYKSILFDLDMTLLDFNQGQFNALKKTFSRYGVNITEKDDEIYTGINQALWLRLERGEIDKSQLTLLRFPTFIEKMGLSLDGIKIDKEYKDNLCNEAILMSGAKQVCETLSERYELFIISNGTDYIQRSRIEKSGLKEYFKDAVTSDEAGAPKPSTDFFDYFFRKEGVSPEKSLIVGDSLTSDILGGVNYSVDTCLVSEKEPQGDIKPTYRIDCLSQLTDLLK